MRPDLLPVGGLSIGALHRMLRTRLGTSFSQPTLRRIEAESGAIGGATTVARRYAELAASAAHSGASAELAGAFAGVRRVGDRIALQDPRRLGGVELVGPFGLHRRANLTLRTAERVWLCGKKRVDTSGELLYRRGFRTEVSRAPLP